jgi:hypothetical protein
MALLDEALEKIQPIAEGRKAETVFYRQRNGFTTAQRGELAAGVSEIRSLMRGLRDALDVRPSDRDARDRVWSQCEVMCDCLEEVSGRQLLRYGAPDPEKADLVTARMREIQARLQSLSDLAWTSRAVGLPSGVVDPEEGEAADPHGSI